MIGKKPIFEPVDDLELDVVEFTGMVGVVMLVCLELEAVDDELLMAVVGAAVVFAVVVVVVNAGVVVDGWLLAFFIF